ncbi:MAG: cobyric acid synthase [Roseovarius sp.]
MAKAIMIQGTGSNVGKSLLVAGLARAFALRGLSVAPFKPQNLSNNAAVTEDGGEIGRAQALQAMAARRAPHTDMNPVLLKPEADAGVQVIVQGQRLDRRDSRDTATLRPRLQHAQIESFGRLAAQADLVLVEGAGSPAEINLRARDIANMGFAEAASLPVVLLGDIEMGGVIAQIVGTKAVLSPGDAARIKAFAINKFHGDARLFDSGLEAIVALTGWPSLGVVPWFDEAWRLPAEDVMDLRESPHAPDTTGAPRGPLKIAVPHLPSIANFDDLDPLSAEPGVRVEIVGPGRPLPGDAALVLLPGSKATIADLAAFRAEGWEIDLAAHLRRSGHVLGICGGYQMLGRTIADPAGLEGAATQVAGLGHLDVDTVMRPEKHLARRKALHIASGETVEGYEIHMGVTTGPDTAHAWLDIEGRPEGAASADGRVRGCYLHGMFTSDRFRARYLAELGAASSLRYGATVEATLDALAAHLEAHLDLDRLLALAEEVRTAG